MFDQSNIFLRNHSLCLLAIQEKASFVGVSCYDPMQLRVWHNGACNPELHCDAYCNLYITCYGPSLQCNQCCKPQLHLSWSRLDLLNKMSHPIKVWAQRCTQVYATTQRKCQEGHTVSPRKGFLIIVFNFKISPRAGLVYSIPVIHTSTIEAYSYCFDKPGKKLLAIC